MPTSRGTICLCRLLALSLYLESPGLFTPICGSGIDLDHSLYASIRLIIIDLCLRIVPMGWTISGRHMARKCDTLLDLHGNIPLLTRISEGKLHYVNVLDDIPIGAGAFYERSRIPDFERLYRITSSAAFFVNGSMETHNSAKALLSASGPDHWSALRPDRHLNNLRVRQSLSGSIAARHFMADADTQKHLGFISNTMTCWHLQLFGSTGAAGKLELLLQMDQATPRNQGLLWHQRECKVKTQNLDRDLGLRVGWCDRPQTPGAGSGLYQILQVLSITLFWKNLDLRALQACDSPRGFNGPRQPVDSVRLVAGQ